MPKPAPPPEHIRFTANSITATIIRTIKSCYGKPKLTLQTHAYIITSGHQSNTTISNILMNLYSKAGHSRQSFKVFSSMTTHDIVSWNTLLSTFLHGTPPRHLDGLHFAVQMRRRGVPIDFVTVTTVISLSSTDASVAAIWFSLQVHCLVLEHGFELDTVVGNSLVTMYMRAGLAGEAQKVFDDMSPSQRDLVSWNAMVSGYAQNPRHRFETVRVFRKMMRLSDELTHVDHVAFSGVLAVCGNENWVDCGEQIHGLAVKYGIESEVSNMLMSAYLRFGMLPAVRRTFEKMSSRDVISWTTMISVDADNAFVYFNKMRRCGVSPNEITFVALASAVETMVEGQGVHGLCCILGFLSDNCVGNSLITMYYFVGASMVDARKVFDEMGEESRDVLSWNALISGYARNNNSGEMVAAFSDMLVKQKPDEYTFGTIIGMISRTGTTSAFPLTHGQQCHCHVIKSSLINFHHVSAALIDMYSRNGHLASSEKLFTATSPKSLMLLTSILSAYALHGHHDRVMGLFHEMVQTGLEPSPIVYLTVLTACSRTGNVETGFAIFRSMKPEPWREHYTTMVDMLARAGWLEEAEHLVSRMPMGPNMSTLQSLLGGCRVHGNAELGERTVEALVGIDPTEAGTYVLLSNIYAERGEWEKVVEVRKRMRNIGVLKEVGFSWVVVDNRGGDFVYRFSSDDMCHPRNGEIYRIVECLGFEMRCIQEQRTDHVYV